MIKKKRTTDGMYKKTDLRSQKVQTRRQQNYQCIL